MYGKGRYPGTTGVPAGYGEDDPILGRPKERPTNINTQANIFGKDRLGNGENKEKLPKSALTMEGVDISYIQNKKLLAEVGKVIRIAKGPQESSLLNEDQIIE